MQILLFCVALRFQKVKKNITRIWSLLAFAYVFASVLIVRMRDAPRSLSHRWAMSPDSFHPLTSSLGSPHPYSQPSGLNGLVGTREAYRIKSKA